MLVFCAIRLRRQIILAHGRREFTIIPEVAIWHESLNDCVATANIRFPKNTADLVAFAGPVVSAMRHAEFASITEAIVYAALTRRSATTIVKKVVSENQTPC
jgi:hypothetical protein